MNNNVQEVLGKFATKINGNIKLFDTRGEAESAAVLEEREAEFVAKAVAYTNSLENQTAKQAKQQQNVIVAFLAYEANAEVEADDAEEGTDI